MLATKKYTTPTPKTRRQHIREAARITAVTEAEPYSNIFICQSPSRTHSHVTYEIEVRADYSPIRATCQCPASIRRSDGSEGWCGHKDAAVVAVEHFRTERWYAAQRRRHRAYEEEAAHMYYSDEEVGA